MNRIQFFYDDDLIALQGKINEWFTANKDKNVVSTNLSALGKPSGRAGVTGTEKYVFYILYTTPIDAMEMQMEHAVKESEPATVAMPMAGMNQQEPSVN